MTEQARTTYRKFVDGLWGKPTNTEIPEIMGEGVSMSDVLTAANRRGGHNPFLYAADGKPLFEPPPSPLSATDRLQRNLERTVSESTARAEVLRQEIAAREAELADVLRAEEAARMGLEALDDRIEEGALDWPFGRPGEVAPITEDELSAACGLALEAEMANGK